MTGSSRAAQAEEVMDVMTGLIVTCFICGYRNYGVKNSVTCECGAVWDAIGENKFNCLIKGSGAGRILYEIRASAF